MPLVKYKSQAECREHPAYLFIDGIIQLDEVHRHYQFRRFSIIHKKSISIRNSNENSQLQPSPLRSEQGSFDVFFFTGQNRYIRGVFRASDS